MMGMKQFTRNQLLWFVACSAIAGAILAMDIYSGEYFKRGRVWLPLGFWATHPHFGVFAGGAIGSLAGNAWIWVMVGGLIPILLFGLMILGGC
jgi:hypothetical protein